MNWFTAIKQSNLEYIRQKLSLYCETHEKQDPQFKGFGAVHIAAYMGLVPVLEIVMPIEYAMQTKSALTVKINNKSVKIAQGSSALQVALLAGNIPALGYILQFLRQSEIARLKVIAKCDYDGFDHLCIAASCSFQEAKDLFSNEFFTKELSNPFLLQQICSKNPFLIESVLTMTIKYNLTKVYKNVLELKPNIVKQINLYISGLEENQKLLQQATILKQVMSGEVPVLNEREQLLLKANTLKLMKKAVFWAQENEPELLEIFTKENKIIEVLGQKGLAEMHERQRIIKLMKEQENERKI
ncbi:Ankyrin_repeat protein 1 [Hexamita inflata]|uniref:Ankyrin repeat protein 1 n=1 Tax=Hexamita inflata TaxID=28002 RepID=A0AA86U5D3_9EUKA|nr:Ankyrin repeat protein 1 [Hexamita inflata]